MTGYWLGVLTLPALVLAGFLLLLAYGRLVAAAARRGVTWDFKWSRDPAGVSDYTLRRDIWWEHSLGPVFAGGWYREPPTYREPTHALINRWVGLGRMDGPNLMVFLSRDLGEVER